MGEARRKRLRFLQSHPLCCFCGGSQPATTIDHVPNRDCFKGRHFPEEFEFPACVGCQEKSRRDEQVFSFVVQMCDRNSDNYDRPKARRAINGIRNNFPHLMPSIIDDSEEKFRALTHLGQPIPVNFPAAKVPLVALPRGIHDHVERVAKKILLAIYYKELGRIAGPRHRAWSSWGFASDLKAMKHFGEVAGMARYKTLGWRRNVAFGDQLAYRWDCSDDAQEGDLFMLVAQFGQGLVTASLLTDQESFEKMVADGEDELDWISVSELAAA